MDTEKINIGVILGTILKWFLGIILILLIGIVVYFLYNLWESGQADIYATEVYVDIDENINANIFYKFWDYISNPGKLRTYDAIVEDNEENGNLGVKIISLESGSPFFWSGQPILIRGTIEAANLNEKESIIFLSCELGSYDGEIVIMPAQIDVPPNGYQIREQVLCSFEDGISTNKNQEAKVAKLKATYEFYTISSYDVYIMREEIYDSIVYVQGKNPFNEYGFFPNNLGPGNKMISTTTAGPVNLGIYTETPQPFSEGDDFVLLLVTLKEDGPGDLLSVSDLKLKVPYGVELSEDSIFCDFEFTGEYDGEYRVYNLNENALNNKINGLCTEEMLTDSGISERRCIEEFKTDITLQCDFSIPNFPISESDFVSTNIIAEANYIYETKKSKTVSIRKHGEV